MFPELDCPRRTDSEFREKKYGGHHKCDSPLLRLDIDMIEQFPVSDSLHLLHLGIMKRMLFGWRDGKFRKTDMRWATGTIIKISSFLLECNLPREIHRAMRGLDCLPHWKGTEYRSFLLYVGIVALKDHTSYEVYQHFLLLFCAIRICESERFSHLIPLAKIMLDDYLERFRSIYGEHYMTSNIHNLTHLTDDVQKFGVLQSFSSYPFESMLGQMKRLVRSGNLPLPQIARRIIELSKLENTLNVSPKTIVSKKNNVQSVPPNFQFPDAEYFSRIDLANFSLSTDIANKWFLTEKEEIVGLKSIISKGNTFLLFGSKFAKHADFFELPLKSRSLNIYAVDYFAKENKIQEDYLCAIADLKCKLVHTGCGASN